MNIFGWKHPSGRRPGGTTRTTTRQSSMVATLSCRIWVCLGWTILVAGTSKASGLFVLQTPPDVGEIFLQQPVDPQPQQATTPTLPPSPGLFAASDSPTVSPPTVPVNTKAPATDEPSPAPPVTDAPSTEPLVSTKSPVTPTVAPTPVDSEEVPIATASPTVVTTEETEAPVVTTTNETLTTPAPRTRAPTTRPPNTRAPRTRAPSFVAPSPLVTSKAPTSAPTAIDSTLSPVATTDSPTMEVVAPTGEPAMSTNTSAPTTASTMSPTVASEVNPANNMTNLLPNATRAPTPARTRRPVARPSSSPTEPPITMPSTVPSAVPSETRSVAPSSVPSVLPSTIPSQMPFISPSILPSVLPSLTPSIVPSGMPSSGPSIAPSDVPSKVPSLMPSTGPSEVPSSLPTDPTVTFRPTAVPTVVPTVAPTTVAPSALPTFSAMPSSTLLGPFVTEGVMNLNGISRGAVDEDATLVFEEQTKAFIEEFYAELPNVVDLAVEIEVTSVEDATLAESERNDVDIFFTQTTVFRNSSDNVLDVDEIVGAPFVSAANRNAFVEGLQADNRTDAYDTVREASFFVVAVPTSAPSDSPTPPEVLPPTLSPTAAATDEPTIAPTSSPTTLPTTSLMPTSILLGPLVTEGIVMKLSGISPNAVDANATLVFEDQTKTFIENFYESENDVSDLTVEIDVTALDGVAVGGSRRGLRLLQTQDVDIQYTQTTSYRKNADGDIDINNVVSRPWRRTANRNALIAALQSDPRTNAYDGVDKATFFDSSDPPNIITPGSDDDSGLDTPILIIIIVIAVVGALCFAAGLFYIVRSCNSDTSDETKPGSRTGAKAVSEVGEEGEEGKPPSHLQLSPIGGQDEVSTLAEPTPRLGVMTSNESLAGYGDQSVATVDYDYSRAYGGGGEASVSSAGGTLGSTTRGTNTVSGGDTVGTGPTGTAGTQSIFSDDASFEAHFRGGQSGQREELIDIYAPPGKLGVVIDTPDDGAPVVHAIKDSSCIADKLKVGDKLVAVDDEDVRSMTAIKVSKLISRKSANATRKLTVIRTTVAE